MVVDARCLVWYYDYGWSGSMNDWNLFCKSEMGRQCERGLQGEYALVGDSAYWPRLYLLTPYRDSKEAPKTGSPGKRLIRILSSPALVWLWNEHLVC